jgi:8-oxo-dGTP pyrophosphatase MutT (NUDIX family)
MSDLPEPIPAATLVLMRERAGGAPELLMTERTGQMAFAAGALVFPGGRIDEADRNAARHFPSVEDAAARIAAIRETIEETGLAPAVAPQPAHDRIAALRTALEQGGDLAALLDAEGLGLELDALVPFARWCPNFRETRRFDTLFYIAEAPPDAPAPQVAAHEAVRAFWASAAEVLGELEAGRAHAIFPTRRNLERLARFGSFAEARADAERHQVTRITPWVEERGGALHVCIPNDIGYPVDSEPLETARRR